MPDNTIDFSEWTWGWEDGPIPDIDLSNETDAIETAVDSISSKVSEHADTIRRDAAESAARLVIEELAKDPVFYLSGRKIVASFLDGNLCF